MGLTTALSATGLAVGLAFTGAAAAHSATARSAGVQSADVRSADVRSAPADVTLPPGGVLEKQITTYCGRVPDLLKRIDKAQTRINADADTKGSLAWLKAKQATAKANKHPRVAERLDRRIDRRSDRLAKLPQLKVKLTAAQGECTSLDLPAPSPS